MLVECSAPKGGACCVHLLTIVWCIMQGVLSFGERLEWAREELCAEQGKHLDTEKRIQFWMTCAKELEASLNMCQAHGKHQDAGHQLGGDVGVAYIMREEWRFCQG